MLLATRGEEDSAVEVGDSSACVNGREMMAEESDFVNTGTSP